MQRRRHPLVIADLEAWVFGDRAPRAPLSGGVTPDTDAASVVPAATAPAPTSPPNEAAQTESGANTGAAA
ncbi:hypothetical protein MRB53_020492 [Persea americana]|uniref:Uncharacterized protein n=1 Tax=Persea americana TaxID=3435 RepID=A0ACC2L1Q1_PERAE|nr:hypothetical protein MRB53_020492 [Persea americana]